jgi:hypothetical protein
MRLSALLFILYYVLKIASITHNAYKKYIGKVRVRVMIKTEDGKRARLFIFNKGRLTSKTGDKIGDRKDYDVALVWKDAATGFSAMISKKKDASFNAAADGNLKVLGVSLYAQWFEDGIKLVM